MSTPRRFVTAAILFLVAGLPAVSSTPGDAPPTVAEAEEFVLQAEETIQRHWIRSERANWVQENFITSDTEKIAAEAYQDLMAVTAKLAKEAVRYDGLDLPFDVRRKLVLLKLSLPLAAPSDPELQAELSEIAATMSRMSCSPSSFARTLPS